MKSPRIVAAIAAVLAMTSVALGAFATHGLRGHLDPGDLATFETAARYQMYHGLALLAVAWIMDRWPGPLVVWSARLILVGVLIFSGSLYVLVLHGQRWLGAVTPLGGLFLMGGWLLLAWHLVAVRDDP